MAYQHRGAWSTRRGTSGQLKNLISFFSDYFAPCHLPAYASAELVIPYWVPTLELGIYQGLGTLTNAELTAVERALSIVKAIATNKNLNFDRLVKSSKCSKLKMGFQYIFCENFFSFE